MRRVSADENTDHTVSKNEMKNSADAKITHSLHRCAEFPQVTTHDENDVRMTVIPNTTSNLEF